MELKLIIIKLNIDHVNLYGKEYLLLIASVVWIFTKYFETMN